MEHSTKNNPLALVEIALNAYSSDSEMASLYPAVELFDRRHDFFIDPDQTALAVLMFFTNERKLLSPDQAGIRRPVSVSIIDATAKIVFATRTITAYIPKSEIAGTYRVDLPFAYGDIDPDHTYKVSVRDETSKVILGESIFHVFDENRCGKHPADWYVCEKGGIIDNQSADYLKAIESDHMVYHTVRFDLRTEFKEMPLIMPETEVRIYFPDGTIQSRFCHPVAADDESDRYHGDMPFLVTSYNRGICYAEIICMDFAVAGFVFSTEGLTVYGEWTGDDLKCLDEYSLMAATERFRSVLGEDGGDPADGGVCDDESDEEDSWNDDDEDNERAYASDDEFEKALQAFITSELCGDSEECDDEAPEENEDTESEEESVEENTEEETVEADDDWLAPLEQLTGLKAVKEKLTVYEKLVRFNKRRLDHNLPILSMPLHAMFLGSPGTGKTTVAKIIGSMLAKAGLLSSGHVVIKERATLLGPHYSDEQTKTLEAIEAAQGGILLIDEAYQLYHPEDPRDPGKFVIDTLLTALADESKRDWMLILAGYPAETRRMFEMNPGFKSRIPESNIYLFDDFTEEELMIIAERYLGRHQFTLSGDARDALLSRLKADYRQRDSNFGNARHVVNMIQTDILPAMATRVVASGLTEPASLSEIQVADIPLPVNPTESRRAHIGFRA